MMTMDVWFSGFTVLLALAIGPSCTGVDDSVADRKIADPMARAPVVDGEEHVLRGDGDSVRGVDSAPDEMSDEQSSQ
jgi:hypothetical protein